MNQGQERFLSFITERVADENQEKAKELLNESFAKQAYGAFNSKYMSTFIPRMLQLIKPEFVDEVKDVMSKHKA